MYAAAREIPNEPGFHRAEEQPALVGELLRLGDVVKYPLYLCAGEICVDEQTCFILYIFLKPLLFKLLAVGSGAAALPDYRIVDGLARLPVPEDGGLTLIGDADARNLARVDLARGYACNDSLKLTVKYRHRVMLDPAALGVYLLELILRLADDVALFVEYYSS